MEAMDVDDGRDAAAAVKAEDAAGLPQEDAVEAGDSEKGLEFILSNLHLRKIIKENHGQPLESLAFNRAKPNENMLATVGGGMVSIYDNNHCGGHLDLSCYFNNSPTVYSEGGLATDVEWLFTKDLFDNEALLAFGCKSGEIGILSVCETRVVGLLKGHTGEILNLRAHPTLPGHLVTSSSDGTIRLWNALSTLDCSKGNQNATCVAIWKPPHTAQAIAISPDGTRIAFGCGNGSVTTFALDLEKASSASKEAETEEVDVEWNQVAPAPRKGCRIDCLEFAEENRLVVHDASGRLNVWSLETLSVVCSMLVPKGDVGKRGVRGLSSKSQTRFGISSCGQYLCCGNPAGEVFIFELTSGKRISKLSMPRIKGFVTAAAFSHDSKSVALCTDDSLLWRWDHAIMEPAPSQSEDEDSS
mmetsp:Transcript_13816/g.25576  ORF Transcript_13816/g.25576 Transcript_13816/m.25576 type:complete len:415 (-) Transcript_13816:78-1322(-)